MPSDERGWKDNLPASRDDAQRTRGARQGWVPASSSPRPGTEPGAAGPRGGLLSEEWEELDSWSARDL